MPSKLYLFRIQRPGEEIAVVHISAPSEDDAILHFLDRDEALGLDHEWFSTQRIDRLLPPEARDGLAPLLKSAPTCTASQHSTGWRAHVAPVHRLRLYRAVDHRGTQIMAAAPNPDVACVLMNETLLPAIQKRHRWAIDDVTIYPTDERSAGVKRLLEDGQFGIAEFDEDEGGRWVW